jgi:hypothetical protein
MGIKTVIRIIMEIAGKTVMENGMDDHVLHDRTKHINGGYKWNRQEITRTLIPGRPSYCFTTRH